jgi:hypothetical protein
MSNANKQKPVLVHCLYDMIGINTNKPVMCSFSPLLLLPEC